MQEYTFVQPPHGDVSQGWALLSVCWAFVAAAFLSTVLRVWVRARLTHNLGADDWVMMFAMFTTIIGAGFITCEVIVGGLGRHSYYLQAAQRRNFAAIGLVDWIQTFITLGLTKISICLFLLRIVDSRRFKIFLYGMIAIVSVFSAVFVFLFIGICRPLKAYWDIGIQGAVCFSDHQFMNIVIAQGVLSIVTDLICALFPIWFLRSLQIKRRTKFALCLLMGLGIITVICCIVRTAYSYLVAHHDITWDIVPNVAWRLPEVNIGIFCANAPVLRPLYLYFRGKLDSQRTGKSYSTSGVSKDRFVMPQNAAWGGGGGGGAGSATLNGSTSSTAGMQQWKKAVEEEDDVALEMGLPAHKESVEHQQATYPHSQAPGQVGPMQSNRISPVMMNYPGGGHTHAPSGEKPRREAWE